MIQLSPAVITALSTVIGAVISGVISLIVASKQHSKTMALVIYRLEQLEKKVDKHNTFDTRMTVVESKLDIK